MQGHNEDRMGWFEKLAHLDRRIIFATVLLAAAFPMIFPFTQRVVVRDETHRFFEALDALSPGSVIILSMDYGPETRPEIDPMAEAVLRQCFSKGVDVIGMVNTIPNIPVGEAVMLRTAREEGAEYGKDFVYLGFRPEPRAVLINFSEEIRKAFPEDYYHTPLDDLPLTARVHNYDDIALVVAVTSDDVSLEWLLTANTRYGVEVCMGISANYYPSFTPYINSGQVKGALGGMKGAAEYEQLLMEGGVMKRPGGATRGMAVQTSVHLLIIAYILLGNVGFFLLRKRRTGGGGTP